MDFQWGRRDEFFLLLIFPFLFFFTIIYIGVYYLYICIVRYVCIYTKMTYGYWRIYAINIRTNLNKKSFSSFLGLKYVCLLIIFHFIYILFHHLIECIFIFYTRCVTMHSFLKLPTKFDDPPSTFIWKAQCFTEAFFYIKY